MNLYIVCLNGQETVDDFWLELYWADDQDHAELQAEDANPGSAVVCVGIVPRDYLKEVKN